MKKIIEALIPSAVIVLFILIMVSGSYFKQSFNENDNVPVMIKVITSEVKNGNWSAAEEEVDQLEKAWEVMTRRVQYSTEREELKNGKRSIARLKGYIEANDIGGVLSELSEVKEQWNDIGKLL